MNFRLFIIITLVFGMLIVVGIPIQITADLPINPERQTIKQTESKELIDTPIEYGGFTKENEGKISKKGKRFDIKDEKGLMLEWHKMKYH